MFTHNECLNIVKKEIPDKFLTFSQQLKNGKYSFLYFDKEVEFTKDKMPCCPNEIIIDPKTGKTEDAYPRMENGWKLFDMDQSDPDYKEFENEVRGYDPVEETIKKLAMHT